MELDIVGAVFQITHNPYNFVPKGGSESDRMVGTAHHVYVLDFGERKQPDDEGSERSILDIRLTDEQVEALRLTKDAEVAWRVSCRPNGNKFRYDLVAPLKVLADAKS
jgi:hypothetical protein